MLSLKGYNRNKIKSFLRQRFHLSADHRRLLVMFILVCAFIILLLLASAFLVSMVEQDQTDSLAIKSFWDGIWWAIVTIATVGYGDKVPLTHAGRLVGMFLIIVGFSLLSVFTGLIASLFVEDKIKGAKGLKQIRTHDHIVICGWNKTAEFLLKAMIEKKLQDTEVCLVTNQGAEFFEEIESKFPHLQLKFVRGEATQEEVLRRASISNAAQVIILADQNLEKQSADDRTIIIANAIHYMVHKDKITVQLHNTENKNLLYRIGISNVIIYDDIGGYILANNIIENHSLKLFSQLAKSAQNNISTLEIPEHFIGKTYAELFDHIRHEKKLILLGLMTKEPELEIDSIFSDNSSAIDQFIKSTLSKSRSLHQDEKSSIRWNPLGENRIMESDLAIVMT
ncbi:MAG: ion channel [Candidatus Cloacimonadaceae bacterium]|nr:ion channel [Candidatus Cloacimonadaceae bacterium]MDP3114284.1 ion channel [Candidatus Cloacimonadaceae bacterium]